MDSAPHYNAHMRDVVTLFVQMAPTLGFFALLYWAARLFKRKGHRVWPMVLFWIAVGLVLIELALPIMR
jgi:hypothetical protein